MRVAVLGAGAVGCTLGAAIHERGDADLLLVARGPQLDALRAGGLRVRDATGERVVRVRAAPELEGPVDVLFLATKTQDLDAASAAAAPRIGDATVVALQNGLAADAIAAKRFGDAHAVGAVSDVVVDYLQPGSIRIGRIAGLTVGRAHGRPDQRVAEVVALLRRAGVPAQPTANLLGARWLKLLVNLNNALPAATGKPVQEVYEAPGIPALASRMLKEGLQVAQHEGVSLESIPTATPALVAAVGWLPDAVAGRLLRARVRKLARAGPILGSTLQSLQRGQPTEIAYLNGEVVARGARAGIATPVNAALVDAVRAIEKGGAFLAPADLVGMARR